MMFRSLTRAATAALPGPWLRHGTGGTAALVQAGAAAPIDDWDPLAQLAQAEAADATLLRLVLCVAGATLALALVTSLA